MVRSLHDALNRCNALATGQAPEVSAVAQDYNNYNFSNENNKDNKSNPRSSFSNKPKQLDYNNYKQLLQRLYSDELYLLAIEEWGIYPKYLCKLCIEHTEHKVRRAIAATRKIRDGYFREDKPIGPQRGAYCRSLIMNGIMVAS